MTVATALRESGLHRSAQSRRDHEAIAGRAEVGE
jgi:hypothetical protein